MNGVFPGILIVLYGLYISSHFTILKDLLELKIHPTDNEIPIPHFETDTNKRTQLRIF